MRLSGAFLSFRANTQARLNLLSNQFIVCFPALGNNQTPPF